MRALRLQPYACDRAREFVSLRLDGQLSELESAFLDSHLGACATCAVFAEDATVATDRIREAPLERLTRPVELPARRPAAVAWRPLHVAAAAAAVVAASVGLFGAGGYPRGDREAAPVKNFGSVEAIRYEISLIGEPKLRGPELPL